MSPHQCLLGETTGLPSFLSSNPTLTALSGGVCAFLRQGSRSWPLKYRTAASVELPIGDLRVRIRDGGIVTVSFLLVFPSTRPIRSETMSHFLVRTVVTFDNILAGTKSFLNVSHTAPVRTLDVSNVRQFTIESTGETRLSFVGVLRYSGGKSPTSESVSTCKAPDNERFINDIIDFSELLKRFVRNPAFVDGLEGYLVFLPPGSMAQAEFIEVLKCLAGGGKNGIQPHFLSRGRAKGRLAIIPPLSPTSTPVNTGASSAGVGSSRDDSSSSGSGSPPPCRQDADEALNCPRILLAPVVNRQRERAERAAVDRAAGAKKKPLPINIPLHEPRVGAILAWLGAVHLPELD
ncbi:hypothetical protein EDD18DRAFT_1348647 [Armillaria luteobubalina]|uniref:Uncharacterized protein n=1 Tax=Armillaria luteobubalina TaxID=153913 RepID=A0AA39QGG9_9AGAR|nr:hypothetical protein EDD18DRAFT_1348647 [Armillaria luteobubalina]